VPVDLRDIPTFEQFNAWNPKGQYAVFGYGTIPFAILALSFTVLLAIDFDIEKGFGAIEVEDESVQGMLAAELESGFAAS
jgi:hypothetical protein